MRINGRYFEIKNDMNQWYEIPLKDLSTVNGLSNWLCHMNEKIWFTTLMQNKMIALCEKHFAYVFNGKLNYDLEASR